MLYSGFVEGLADFDMGMVKKPFMTVGNLLLVCMVNGVYFQASAVPGTLKYPQYVVLKLLDYFYLKNN